MDGSLPGRGDGVVLGHRRCEHDIPVGHDEGGLFPGAGRGHEHVRRGAVVEDGGGDRIPNFFEVELDQGQLLARLSDIENNRDNRHSARDALLNARVPPTEDDRVAETRCEDVEHVKCLVQPHGPFGLPAGQHNDEIDLSKDQRAERYNYRR